MDNGVESELKVSKNQGAASAGGEEVDIVRIDNTVHSLGNDFPDVGHVTGKQQWRHDTALRNALAIREPRRTGTSQADP